MRKFLIKAFNKPMTGIIISVLAGFVIGAVVLAVAGYSPLEAYSAMFWGIVGKPKYIAQVIINAVPIILTGLSVAFAFKTGLFNIGAEGQYCVGTIVAAILGRYVPLPPVLHPIFVLLAAFLLGGLFGGLSGWLKTKFGIHEVISTIMLNWIALYLNNFILSLPGVKKEGQQASHEILPSARIRILTDWKRTDEGKEFLTNSPIFGDMLRTDIHVGILLAVLVVIAAWYFLRHTTKGFELRAVGFNHSAAEFAGIDVKKNTVSAMFLTAGDKVASGISTFKDLPKNTNWGIDAKRELLHAVTGVLQIDFSDNFPLTLYLSRNGGIMYSAAGYRIGIGDEVLKIIRKESKTGCN